MSVETRTRVRERIVTDAASAKGNRSGASDQSRDLDRSWRNLFRNGAWLPWVTSLGLHLTILVALGAVYYSIQDENAELEIETVIDYEEGETIGFGPDLDTEIMEMAAPDAVPTSTPTFGISNPVIEPINVGVSSMSGGTMQTAGGPAGNPGRVGEIDQRVAAGGGNTAGNLRISLAWEDMNDLDLHIQTPDDETIYFGNTRSECGGELDVDANVAPTTATPVENVVWAASPRDGVYQVGVHFYSHHPNQPVATKCDILFVIGTEKRFLTVRALHHTQFVEVATFELRDGELVEFTPSSRVRESDERVADNGPVEDEKREAQRREFAQDALDEALGQQDARVRGGRLERLIERFPSTPAAEEAQRLLDAMDETE